MRLNIQTKLLVILLAIGIPTLVVMGILGYANGSRTIRNFVREGLLSLNATKARHLESYMDELRRSVEVIGEDKTVKEALRGFAASSNGLPDAQDPAALWAFFGKTYPASPGKPTIEPADTESARRLQELYVSENPLLPNQPGRDDFLGADDSAYTRVHREHHKYLQYLRDSDRVNNIMLVDAASRRIVYAVKKHADFQASLDGPLLRGTNLQTTVERALKGSTNIVDFQRFAPAFNFPVAYVSAPIRDERGEIIGCVVAQININEINRILSGDKNWKNEGLGETGDTHVLGADRMLRNDSRALIQHKESLIRDLRARGVKPEEIDYIRRKNTTVLAYALDTPAAFAVTEDRSGFQETYGFNRSRIFVAYAPLEIEGLDWGIISRRDVNETLAPLNDFRRNAILTGIGVLILIAGLAVPLAKSFVAPIEAMSGAARRFGQNERGIRLAEGHRDDEFGELARQFNVMVEESERHEKIQQGIRRNIVHDPKTPVTVIKGMGETLLFPGMAEDATWREEMVRAIVEQSDRLLDDLKDILQPIDAAYKPDLEEFDLSLLIERVVKAEKHTSRAADHLMILTGTAEPINIAGDRRKLRRVYENLLSNAIKYSPGNGKRVEVTLARVGEDEVAVTFRDEGLGMEPEDLERVLVRGGRVSSHADLGIEGTGFGLDSVQTVLQAHGGRLEAQSETNRGSTFTAILPLRVKIGTSGPGSSSLYQ